MHDLPQDLFALLMLAFAFGVKHGLDPDHLATIDGLSRFNAVRNVWLARWAGGLFSIGHGLVVTTVIVVLAWMPNRFALPEWLEELGMTVSIFTLLILGVINLSLAFKNENVISSPVGLKNYLRIQSGHPLVVLGMGALFALSFDTMSMATFFSLAAIHISFESYAVILGLIFTCGMIVSDGINGLITTHMIKKSAARAMIASRLMSFVIGSLSIFIAFLGIFKLIFPGLSEKIEYAGVWPGMLVLLWVLAGFAFALLMARASELNAARLRR